jgi:hypothetical protein
MHGPADRRPTRRAAREGQAPGDEPPDVIGFPLEDARRMLEAAGWPEGEISETRAPRRALVGPQRVVRQRVDADGRVALVVCGERSEDARV